MASGTPMTVPIFSDAIPVCFHCGTPCGDCRADMKMELPKELVSASEIMKIGQKKSKGHKRRKR